MELTDHDKEILQAILDGKPLMRMQEYTGLAVECQTYEALFFIADKKSKKISIKPETIMIGDAEVSAPLKRELKKEETYYIPELDNEIAQYKECYNHNLSAGLRHVRLGIAHLTKEAAIQHAKALIKVSGGSYE